MTIPRVTENGFSARNQEIPWLAAEFHYWRNSRKVWREVLARIREAGFTIVTSFVQWNWHETSPGEFDFVGKTVPERDLPGFLDLCREIGLFAHLRPGPACCEWRESGGTSFGTPWHKIFDAFWAAVKDHQTSRGGALLALQIHNEWFDPVGTYYILKPFVDSFDGFTCPPEHRWTVLCGPNGHYLNAGYRFQLDFLAEYLRWKYRTAEALSHAWGRPVAAFEDVVSELREEGIGTFHEYMCFIESRFRGVQFFLANPCELLDLLGWAQNYMGVPLGKDVAYARKKAKTIMTHNWAMGVEAEFNDLANLDLSGYDFYGPENMNIWQWNYLVHDLQANRLPFCGEFETGFINPYMWGGLGEYKEAFSRLTTLSYFAEGLRAINLYMFVERDNWCMCPLDERGGRRPTYEALSDEIAALKAVRWHHRRVAHDLTVVKFTPYFHMASDSFDSFPDRGFHFPWLKENLYGGFDPKKDFFDLYVRLHEAHLSFVTVKAGQRNAAIRATEVVYAYSLRFMGADLAGMLRRYAEQGGTLILGPEVPGRDTSGRALRAFADLPVSKGSTRAAEQIVFDDGFSVPCPKGFKTHVFPKGKTCRRTIRLSGGEPCGYEVPVKKGRIIVIGFPPASVPGAMTRIFGDWAGVRRYAGTDVPESHASVGLEAGSPPAVIIYNGNAEKPVQELTLSSKAFARPGTWWAFDLLAKQPLDSVVVPDGEGAVRLPVRISPRDASIIAFSREGKPPLVLKKPAFDRELEISDWTQRAERFTDYESYYAGSKPGGSWVSLPGKEWTLPAIASGRIRGVQGWFWFRQTVSIPRGSSPVFLRFRLHGYHNLAVAYVNGRRVGYALAERPGGEAVFDVTEQMKRGGKTLVAIRLLRQSLDCHDRGVSGFEEVALETGGKRFPIDSWKFQQESLIQGERKGWHKAASTASGWTKTKLPKEWPLHRSQDILWLRGKVNCPKATAARLEIKGRDAQLCIYVNGQYLVKTPYLPVELPLNAPLKKGKNVIALRIMSDPARLNLTPREDRYREFVQNALALEEVTLDSVRLLGEG